MNQFEQQLVDKVLEAVHEIEVKVVQEVGQINTQISSLSQKSEVEHKSLREVVERNITTDTDRLNKHSEELDEHSEKIAKLEEWKNQFQKQVAHRIAISQSITAVAAVVIAFLLSKFF